MPMGRIGKVVARGIVRDDYVHKSVVPGYPMQFCEHIKRFVEVFKAIVKYDPIKFVIFERIRKHIEVVDDVDPGNIQPVDAYRSACFLAATPNVKRLQSVVHWQRVLEPVEVAVAPA